MPGPPTFLRALVAAVGLPVGLAALMPVASVASVAPVAPVAASSAQSQAPTPGAAPRTPSGVAPLVDDAPLRVTISTMSPGALPVDGDIRLTGEVTNRSDETWTGIKVYSFVGDQQPAMRNQGQLEQAMASPFDEYLGDRFINQGEPGDIARLEPGATASYRLTLPAEAVRAEISEAGVYWFGVHALGGIDGAASDAFADGRARTFLPYVPKRFDVALPGALVVPLTQPVRYAADGTVDDVEEWTRALGPDGRLTKLLDFVDTSGRPVTWLVDPAVLDAVGRLAAGNPERALGPSAEPAPNGDGDGPTPPGDESDQPADAAVEGEELSPEAASASAWLAHLRDTVAGDEVLSLPYGNIDVPATVRHDPALVDLARAQRSDVLARLGIEAGPVVSSPSGYLDLPSIRAAGPESRVLVTDRMFGDKPPAVASVEGRPLVVTSYGATQGSPGPGSSLTSVGLRQRLLAEAAVRVIKGDRKPLSVVLPLEWNLDDPVGFFSGLTVPWLDLGTVGEIADATPPDAVDPADLDYLRLQRRRELDASTVAGVGELIDAGDTLQDVLVDNNEVGGLVTEEALTGLSYFARNTEASSRLAVDASRSWLDDRLSGIEITASRGVTLSGGTGTFLVTLSNSLDHGVVVGIDAESDDDIEIVDPGEVEIAARGRTTVSLTARTSSNRVHNVRLIVTDASGTTPLGSQAELPIRSAQVSGVIWLIMGTGAGLLFLAIAVRLFRRIVAARRGGVAARDAGTGRPVEVV